MSDNSFFPSSSLPCLFFHFVALFNQIILTSVSSFFSFFPRISAEAREDIRGWVAVTAVADLTDIWTCYGRVMDV